MLLKLSVVRSHSALLESIAMSAEVSGPWSLMKDDPYKKCSYVRHRCNPLLDDRASVAEQVTAGDSHGTWKAPAI